MNKPTTYSKQMEVYKAQLRADIAYEEDCIKHFKKSIELSEARIELANEALTTFVTHKALQPDPDTEYKS